MRVGICEDDQQLQSVLARALAAESFRVRVTGTGRDAVRVFSEDPPDLLVLDIGLPDADGRDVCQALRAHGVDAPVLFLTARGQLADKLSAFHAGGDDFLSKPFALAELVVRAHALVKRRRVALLPAAAPGELRLDPSRHGVSVGERTEALTPTEFRVLAVLIARPGVVVRRRELVAAGWPDGAIVNENTLDAYVGRLRRKLRALDASEQIETARGVGYVLRRVPATAAATGRPTPARTLQP
ncbi:winged helix family two component transcriptional regulator [Solirubrobacter pauli]|uniref:Winged helix family two component transcriptional regulator n=1 Tax=Solirubrobacter pauli TaxID=166793 RepID=A0A660L0C2_9ACTN|nr:response regulator transcription factor [Solirubrobacter pauli]RKQ86888.1 winged helix family two component transcriptional regulator [Solirubrobacter pauli]